MIPTAVITTRGDVDLAPVLKSLPKNWPVVVWDNSKRPFDVAVYGYFAALAEVKTQYVYTQADDAICPAADLRKAWTPKDKDRIVLNVADGDTPWISFGAIFRKDLPVEPLRRYMDAYHEGDLSIDVRLWCEVIFCELVPWRNVDLGKRDLPWCTAPDRMWMQPSHYTEQARVRAKALALR